MTEQQATKAMELLARLYAEQIGMINPAVEITKEEEG